MNFLKRILSAIPGLNGIGVRKCGRFSGECRAPDARPQVRGTQIRQAASIHGLQIASNAKGVVIISGAVALILLFSHCRKIELPPPDAGVPVFALQARLDGVPLEISAGDSSYVLRASFRADSLGVPVYQGAFRELGCASGCRPAISFSVRGAGPGPARPEAELQPGRYAYLQPLADSTEIIYKAQFAGMHEASTVDAPLSYRWDFGDGSTSNLQNPEHLYPDDSPRLVRLESRNGNGCASYKEKRIAFEPQPVPCEVDFVIQPAQGAFPAEAVMEGPLSNYEAWSWFEGDSSLIANYPLPQLVPQDTLEQCLTATTIDGCQAQSCQSVFLNSFQDFEYCATDFSYQVEVDTFFMPAPDQYGTVWVEYTDESGRLFSSAFGAQDSQGAAFFDIIAREPFEPNENGQPTVKLEISFQCLLYGAGGQLFGTLSGTGVIAVAHP